MPEFDRQPPHTPSYTAYTQEMGKKNHNFIQTLGRHHIRKEAKIGSLVNLGEMMCQKETQLSHEKKPVAPVVTGDIRRY